MPRTKEKLPKNWERMSRGEQIVWHTLGKKGRRITRHDRSVLAIRIDAALVLARDEQRNADVRVIQNAMNTIASDYD